MRPVDIEIISKADVLQELRLSQADFDRALESALDRLVGVPTHQLPTPRNITVTVRGQEFRLGDLASIDVFLCRESASGHQDPARSQSLSPRPGF